MTTSMQQERYLSEQTEVDLSWTRSKSIDIIELTSTLLSSVYICSHKVTNTFNWIIDTCWSDIIPFNVPFFSSSSSSETRSATHILSQLSSTMTSLCDAVHPATNSLSSSSFENKLRNRQRFHLFWSFRIRLLSQVKMSRSMTSEEKLSFASSLPTRSKKKIQKTRVIVRKRSLYLQNSISDRVPFEVTLAA